MITLTGNTIQGYYADSGSNALKAKSSGPKCIEKFRYKNIYFITNTVVLPKVGSFNLFDFILFDWGGRWGVLSSWDPAIHTHRDRAQFRFTGSPCIFHVLLLPWICSCQQSAIHKNVPVSRTQQSQTDKCANQVVKLNLNAEMVLSRCIVCESAISQSGKYTVFRKLSCDKEFITWNVEDQEFEVLNV